MMSKMGFKCLINSLDLLPIIRGNSRLWSSSFLIMKTDYGKKNIKFRKVVMIYKILEYIYKNRLFGYGFKIPLKGFIMVIKYLCVY